VRRGALELPIRKASSSARGRYSNSLRILFDGSKLSAEAAALRGDGGRGHFGNLKETALLDQDNDAQACQEDSQVPGYAE
jgi:hypothetical protein